MPQQFAVHELVAVSDVASIHWDPGQCTKPAALHTREQAGADLDEGDDVLEVVQLQDVGLHLGQHGQRDAQQHVRPLLLQQHVDDAARELGREGA